MADKARETRVSFFKVTKDELEQNFFIKCGYKIVTGHMNGIRDEGVWVKAETPKIAKNVGNVFNSEKKKADREKRCLIENDNGKLIRCPETRKCSSCPNCRSGNPYSLDYEVELNGDKFNDPGTVFEEDLISTLLARELFDRVNKLGGRHKKVMEALLKDTSVRDFAKQNGIGKSTAQDWYSQFRKFAKDFIGD